MSVSLFEKLKTKIRFNCSLLEILLLVYEEFINYGLFVIC
jgi:hypothetical protein